MIERWLKEKDLEWWVVFNGQSIPCTFHELSSHVSLPEIGGKRYVLQCMVPETKVTARHSCPVTLNVYGMGGKSLAQGLYMGNFTYRENGNLNNSHS